jgi:mannose-6-phosphate isomerase-like protein (cupin superfamily)
VSEKFQVARLAEMEIPQQPQAPRWAAVRHHLGIEAFGVNAWTADVAGKDVISEHDELGTSAGKHEELYVVIGGRATFTVDGETIEAPEGTCVFVGDPAAKRKAVADEPETTVLAIGAKAGEAFKPSRWERSGPAFGYFATKEYEKARAILAEVHAEFPDDAGVLFNLACAESLLGSSDDAIEHLSRSIANEERFREIAKSDSDFDAIREDPRFVELVGSS